MRQSEPGGHSSAGRKAIAIRCNVAAEYAVAGMVRQTISTFGQLDIAFNNAGVHAPVAETADALGEDFDRVITINLRGIWNCVKYEIRHMPGRGSGVIVNCSSAERISWNRRALALTPRPSTA